MNDENKISGIYSIVNIINQKVYIGSSKDVLRRIRDHKRNLNSNKHTNTHLQNSWNKYKETNFIFSIIEKCVNDRNVLMSIEQKYIDYFLDRKSVV
jgi:group I intron endonuclease